MNIENILKERGESHGDYGKQGELFCDLVHLIMRGLQDNKEFYSPTAFSSVIHILNKISRITLGDDQFEDHWVDIAGYAELELKEIRKRKE